MSRTTHIKVSLEALVQSSTFNNDVVVVIVVVDDDNAAAVAAVEGAAVDPTILDRVVGAALGEPIVDFTNGNDDGDDDDDVEVDRTDCGNDVGERDVDNEGDSVGDNEVAIGDDVGV